MLKVDMFLFIYSKVLQSVVIPLCTFVGQNNYDVNNTLAEKLKFEYVKFGLYILGTELRIVHRLLTAIVRVKVQLSSIEGLPSTVDALTTAKYKHRYYYFFFKEQQYYRISTSNSVSTLCILHTPEAVDVPSAR